MSESTAQSGLSCLTKSIIGMVVVPVLLVLAVVIWWLSRQTIARGRLNDTLAELRTDGLPADVASLQKFYEQQTDAFQADRWIGLLDRVESAAFRKAAGALPILGSGKDVPTAAADPWPNEAAVRSFLAEQDFIFREVADLRGSAVGTRYPTSFDSQTPLTKISETRTLSRLLALRHRVALRDQDRSVATDCVLSMIAVARSMEGQVTLINHLIRLANLQNAIHQLRLGLRDDAYDVEGIRQIAKALEQRDAPSDQLQLAIQGERAFMLNAALGLKTQMPMSPVLGSSAILHAVDLMSRLSDAVSPDIFASVKEIQAISAQVDRDHQNANFVTQLDSAMTPNLGTSLSAFSQSEMLCRLAETALHIQLYQKMNGTWPNTISDLNDLGFSTASHTPPGKRPFGYRVEPGGVALVWGFPLRPTQNLQAMTETPDDPPFEGIPDEDTFVYQLASPKLTENP